MEYELPRANGWPALREVIAWIRKKNLPVAFPFEFRIVARDDIWLSPFQGREGASISMHQYHRMAWRDIFSEAEKIFRAHDGRPHWAKRHTLTTADVHKLYPDAAKFCAVRDKIDPGAKFANAHLSQLFGIEAKAADPMNDRDLHAHLINQQGGRKSLNTPVLLIDLDAFERNVAAMAAFAKANGLRLRPHAKTHKCAEIARRQVAAGAVGVCCAKLGEAEEMAAGGIASILITSPVVSPQAIARLITLNDQIADLQVAVDNPDNAEALAAATTGKPLKVLIDVDPGIRRTGVASAEAAVALAQAIAALPAARHSRRAVLLRPPAAHRILSPNAAPRSSTARTISARVIAALTEAGFPPASSRAAAPARTGSTSNSACSTSCRPAPTSSWIASTMSATSPAKARQASRRRS